MDLTGDSFTRVSFITLYTTGPVPDRGKSADPGTPSVTSWYEFPEMNRLPDGETLNHMPFTS